MNEMSVGNIARKSRAIHEKDFIAFSCKQHRGGCSTASCPNNDCVEHFQMLRCLFPLSVTGLKNSGSYDSAPVFECSPLNALRIAGCR